MIRSLASAFFFALSLISLASGGAQVFTAGNFQGLKGSDGGVLIPPVYDALGWSDGSKDLVNDVIGYYEDGKWGLINSRNKRITTPKYAVLSSYDEQYVLAALKGQFTNHLYHGLIDSEGQAFIDFHFFSIEKWNEQTHLVSEYRESTIYFGTCDSSGKIKIPLQYKRLEQLDALTVAVLKDGSKFLYDALGEPVFQETLDQVETRPEGFLVSRRGSFGLVSPNGVVVHPVKGKSIESGQLVPFPTWEIRSLATGQSQKVACDSLSLSEEGLWILHVNRVEQFLGGSELLIDKNQNELRYIGNGYMITKNKANARWALHKTDGKLVAGEYDSIAFEGDYFYCLSPKGWDIYSMFGRKLNTWPYEAVGASSNRNIPTRKNGYWGWIDFQGNQLIDFKYDQVEPIRTGSAFLVEYIGSWGVADFSDRFLISPAYQSMRFTGTCFLAGKGSTTTVFTKEGKEIYKSTARFSGTEPLTFREDTGWGIILPNNQVIDPQYDSIKGIGDYIRVYKSGLAGLLSSEGGTVISFKDCIQEIYSFSEGYFHVKKDQQHGFVDTYGRLRIANRYEQATDFSDSLAAIKLRGKWGLIDRSESLVIQPFYQSIGLFQQDHAIIKQGAFYGLVRKDGREILTPEWIEIRRQATGNYLLTDKSGRNGIADARGKILLMPAFEAITDTDKGLLIATQGGKMGVMDYQGFTKVPFVYAKIEIKGDYLLLMKHL